MPCLSFGESDYRDFYPSPREACKDVQVISDAAETLRIGVVNRFWDIPSNLALDCLFLCRYPNARIEYSYFDSDESLRAELFSGNPQVDLLVLPSQTIDTLAAQGLIHDFSTSLLNPWPDCWIDFSNVLRDEEGHIYSFPCRMDQTAYIWDNGFYYIDSLERPAQNWTWDDFAALCHQIDQLNTRPGYRYYLTRGASLPAIDGFAYDFFEEYFNTVALKTGRFDEQDMERLLNLFMDIKNTNALTPRNAQEPQMLLDNTTLDSISFASSCDHLYSALPLPSPTLNGDDPLYLCSYMGYVLLNNAPHSDLALSYLQAAFLPEVLNADIGNFSRSFSKDYPRAQWWYPDSTFIQQMAPGESGRLTWVMDASFMEEQVYVREDKKFYAEGDLEEGRELIKELENDGCASWWLAFQEVQKNYQAYVLPRSILSDARWDDLAPVFFQLLQKYATGGLTAQGMCDALNNRLEMMEQ